jgi:hypothetical protein
MWTVSGVWTNASSGALKEEIHALSAEAAMLAVYELRL